MRLRAIMRTTAARLSALYLVLFAVCAVFLVFYMTALSVGFLLNETRATVEAEVAELGSVYGRGGIRGLVRAIDRRSRQPGANLYLVADPAGRILAGNVEALDPGILDMEGWTAEPFRYQRFGEQAAGDRPRDYQAVAQVIGLPNGMRILVGRDLGEPARFRAVVRRALIAALGVMGLGALAIWFFVGRNALKRIDSVSDASRRIMGGDLAGRLPVTGSGDEFDRLSENLNAMLGRIQTLNEGLKQVSDSIAHDLKTPLTRLRNRAEQALAIGEGDEWRGAMEKVVTEADQLIAVFNALLMISRVEAGYSGQELTSIDLAAIARDIGELYEPVAEEAGIVLEVDAPGEAFVRGSRELVGQALTNLIDNAIKYAGRVSESDHDPRQTTGLESGEKARICLTVRRASDAYEISVEDNGPGIAEADRERVLERFVRLDESRSKPGSGLGLSLVRAVMRLHGGAMRLEDSTPGLRVVLRFPEGVDGGKA